MYLLDTNAWIGYLRGSAPAVRDRLRQIRPAQVRLCSIVKAELYAGARASSRVAENLRLLEQTFSAFVSLPFDDACAECLGETRAMLRSAGTPIGAYDEMIAATALAFDQILVTHNVREFQRVPGLRIEDWEAE